MRAEQETDSIQSLAQRLRSSVSWIRGLPPQLWHDAATRTRAWIIVATCLVIAYSLAVLVYVLATPEIGVRCAFTPVVNHFYPEFLYPDDQEPLRDGDRIIEIAGHPVATWSGLLRNLTLLGQRQPEAVPGLTARQLVDPKTSAQYRDVLVEDERLVRVVYERPGEDQPRTVWCRLGRSPIESLVPSILWFCLKFGLFLVGAIVLWKKPDDLSAVQFFWLCIVTLGAYMGGYHWSRIVTQPVLLMVFMTCAVLLPAVTLHFYLVYPRPRSYFLARSRLFLAVIYGLPSFFLLLFLQGYFRVRWLAQGADAGALTSIEQGLVSHEGLAGGVRLVLLEMLYEIYAYFAVAALWYLASVASLVLSYRSASNVAERNQVKWILIGAAAALLPIGYTLYLAIWEQGKFGGVAATWPMFAASVCITLAYAVSITRYRLLQLDQLLESGASYFLLSSIAGLVYYGVVFAGLLLVGSRFVDGPSLGQVLGVAGTAMVLMIALDLVRGRLLRALDRHLRREKYNLDRTLQRMSQAIDRLVDPATLGRHLLHTSAELLSAPSGSVYLRQGDPPIFRLTEAIGSEPPLAELSPGCPLVEALRARATLGPEANPVTPPGRQLALLGGVVAQGLSHEGQFMGLLVLGRRENTPYTPEEVQILAAFAQIAVLALVSAEGHRTIETLNQDLKAKVEKIAEQQRRILALQSQLSRNAAKENEARLRESGPGTAEFATANEEKKPTTSTGEGPAPVPPQPGSPPESGLIGSSPQVQQLMHLIRRVANSSSAVLLRGESGTGKELLARALHENSPRASQPFIKVHCAALSPGVLESELFGHVKGAFTSAIRDKIGRFESADGGTLFLDEIGDINLEVQTKLLRVLEEMSFERVGSSEPIQVDVRIIAATHRNLEAMIQEGKFREDLYFRLNVLPIHVPPLRDRGEDVPELILHFLRIYSQKLGKAIKQVDDDALVVLKNHPWPGNVRQLENAIERAVVICEGETITLAELPDEVKQEPELPAEETDWQPGTPGLSLPELAGAIHAERIERDRREREQLVRALAAAGGNKAEAARALGLARSTLVSRLKKLGLS